MTSFASLRKKKNTRMPTIRDDDPSRADAHVDVDIEDDDDGQGHVAAMPGVVPGMSPGVLSEILPGMMLPEMLSRGGSAIPTIQQRTRSAVQIHPAMRAMYAMQGIRADPPHAFEVPMDAHDAAPTRRSQVRLDLVPRVQTKDLIQPSPSRDTAAPNQSITAAPNQSIVEWIGNNVLSLMSGGGDNDMLTESASTADCAIMAMLAVVVLAMCMFMQCTQQTILIRDLMRRL